MSPRAGVPVAWQPPTWGPRASTPRAARVAPSLSSLVFFVVLAACGPARSPAGSPCTLATQCDTRLCLFGGDGGGVCARPCSDSTGCSGDQVCGRFDFRPIDPDSGMPSGDESEIVRVCRAPLNAPCGPGRPCAGNRVCLGEPMGVCTVACAQNTDCASGRCIAAAACGLAGSCAPVCDDLAECPRGWYCNTSPGGAVASSSGRCDPVAPGDDAGSAPGCDAGGDAGDGT